MIFFNIRRNETAHSGICSRAAKADVLTKRGLPSVSGGLAGDTFTGDHDGGVALGIVVGGDCGELHAIGAGEKNVQGRTGKQGWIHARKAST